jgi:hypothetical protein
MCYFYGFIARVLWQSLCFHLATDPRTTQPFYVVIFFAILMAYLPFPAIHVYALRE